MPAPLLRTATGAEAGRCLAVLTLAFGSDPPFRWLWPDPQQYLEAFPRLSACDGQKRPAYLEATSPRNIRFYERHGFEALGRIQVGDAPPVVPMRRKPK